jgi:hypothetical protein
MSFLTDALSGSFYSLNLRFKALSSVTEFSELIKVCRRETSSVFFVISSISSLCLSSKVRFACVERNVTLLGFPSS